VSPAKFPLKRELEALKPSLNYTEWHLKTTFGVHDFEERIKADLAEAALMEALQKEEDEREAELERLQQLQLLKQKEEEIRRKREAGEYYEDEEEEEEEGGGGEGGEGPQEQAAGPTEVKEDGSANEKVLEEQKIPPNDQPEDKAPDANAQID